MFIWTTFHTMIDGAKIRLDMLEQHGKTAGWIVRRACNVYQAFTPSPVRPVDGVVDLLTDGVLIGQACDSDGARRLIEEALDIEDTSTNPVLILQTAVVRPDPASA